jgi:hypothetical protein
VTLLSGKRCQESPLRIASLSVRKQCGLVCKNTKPPADIAQCASSVAFNGKELQEWLHCSLELSLFNGVTSAPKPLPTSHTNNLVEKSKVRPRLYPTSPHRLENLFYRGCGMRQAYTLWLSGVGCVKVSS